MDSENDPLDSIRNELNKIISQSAKQNSPLTEVDNLNSESLPKSFDDRFETDYLEQLENSESSKRAAFLHTTAAQDIDDDIQKMRLELTKSYQLFQSAGEAFDSINFNSLKYRIRDLHLSATQKEMDTVLDEKTVKDSLNKLTDIMGQKFGQHPGEFGDIPELSAFFKACTQLQHGLESLKRHRTDMTELGNRMTWATNVSNDRSEEIIKAISKKESSMSEFINTKSDESKESNLH